VNKFFTISGMPIALGKEKFGLPEKEEHAWTNFI
jgi:hypothetical protein